MGEITVRRGVPLHGQHQSHRGGDANGRSAADAQGANRFPYILNAATVAQCQRHRQEGLVDEADMAIV